MPQAPLFVLLAGPNGAGKSTLYRDQLLPLAERFDMDMGPFLNADDYARQRWGADHDPSHDYEAAQHIAALRDERMAQRQPIVTETVFSHPSKQDLLDQATRLGYQVHLEIVIVPLSTSFERVAARVRDGGHDVPPDKLQARYARTDQYLAQAISSVANARIWNNATDAPTGTPSHTRIARFEHGRIVARTRTPDWMPPQLAKAITTASRGNPPRHQ